jgi:uncharacterized protein (DUF4415 family)
MAGVIAADGRGGNKDIKISLCDWLKGPKQQLTVRLDKDVIDWFRSQGSGYQTRRNAVLRSYVEAQRPRTQ